jgi:transcriptional regulator with XRE-family HTH domain
MITVFKLLAEESGLTDRELAAKYKRSVKTIYAWMQGRRRAPDDVIENLRALISKYNEKALFDALMDRPPSLVNDRGYMRKYAVNVKTENLQKLSDFLANGA